MTPETEKPSDFDAAMESIQKLFEQQEQSPPEFEDLFWENWGDLLA